MVTTLPEAHILTAFAPVREAVGRAIPERGDVFLCSRQDIYDFLLPMVRQNARVILLPECYRPRILRADDWLKLLRRREEIKRTLHTLGPIGKFCVYGIGFDLASLIATAYLAKTIPGEFSSYDAYEHSPPHYQIVRDFKHRVIATALSAWLQTPLVFSRQDRPILRLGDDFVRGKLSVIDETNRDRALARFACSPHADALKSRCSCKILWLYDNLPAYYGLSEAQTERWFAIWKEALNAVRNHIPASQQAVKPHPDFTGPLPEIFSGIEELPRSVPIEFVEFPSARLVVGCNSLATLPFLAMPGCEVHLLTRLFDLPEHGVQQMEEILIKRILPAGRPTMHCDSTKLSIEIDAAARKSS